MKNLATNLTEEQFNTIIDGSFIETRLLKDLTEKFGHSLNHDQILDLYQSHIQYLENKVKAQIAYAEIYELINGKSLVELDKALRAHPDVALHSITLASDLERMNK